MQTVLAAVDYFVFGGGAYVLAFISALFALAAVMGFVRLADVIKRFLEIIAFASGWLLIVLMCVTCMDITFRKLQLPIALTQFQELEWHLHTTIFSMWMGYNYTINAHPRVDSYTETLGFRTRVKRSDRFTRTLKRRIVRGYLDASEQRGHGSALRQLIRDLLL